MIVLLSSSRQARAGILILSTVIPLIFTAIRWCGVEVHRLRQGWFTGLIIVLILTAGVINYQQLFIAFEGGKTYFHKAYDLEIYNYPLYLRPLNGPDDMHTHPYSP